MSKIAVYKTIEGRVKDVFIQKAYKTLYGNDIDSLVKEYINGTLTCDVFDSKETFFRYCNFWEDVNNVTITKEDMEKRITEVINMSTTENNMGTEYDITKCFDDIEPLIWSDDEINNVAVEAQSVIEKYEFKEDCSYTADAIYDIIRESNLNKGWIERILSKHINYIPKKHMIVLTGEYCRDVNFNGMGNFFNWVRREINKIYDAKNKDNLAKLVTWVDPNTGEVKENTLEELIYYRDILNNISAKRYSNWEIENYILSIKQELKEIDDTKLLEDSTTIQAIANDFDKGYKNLGIIREKYYKTAISLGDAIANTGLVVRYGYNMYSYNGNNKFMLTKEETCSLDKIMNFIDMLCTWDKQTIDNYMAESIDKDWHDEIRPVAEQRTTKIINKFAKAIGLNKIVDIRTESYFDDAGNEHTRQKDWGWNKQYTMYCDAISPLKVKQYTCISVNPIDYFRMSMGNDWASCHTIDKTNIDGRSHTYSGCYSSGTISYLLDGSTVEMYVIRENYTGGDYELENKIHRCNFHIGNGKIVQGRVYPDGRDGGTFPNIAKEMREIFCRVISECLDIPNIWTVKEGKYACCQIATKGDGATCYPDWANYDDCVAIRVGNTETEINPHKIVIGEQPRCVCCGEYYYNEEYIMCDSCRNEQENNVKTYSGEWAYIDDVFWDEYYHAYFLYDDLNIVITHDGKYFGSEHSAEYYGYVYVEDDNEYYPEEECEYCENCEKYVLIENYDFENQMCVYCLQDLECI